MLLSLTVKGLDILNIYQVNSLGQELDYTEK